MKKLFFYLVAFAVLPLSSAQAGSEVRLKPYGNRYMVEAILDGRVKARMIIDTGASHTVISTGMARRLGMTNPPQKAPWAPLSSANGVEWMRLVTLQSVAIGGQGAKMVEAAVSSRLGRGVDGLLGMSFLGDFSHTIDGPKMRLVLKPAYESGQLYGGKNKAWWSLRFGRYQKTINKYASIRDRIQKGSPPMAPGRLKAGKAFSNKDIGALLNYYKGLLAGLARRARALSLPASWRNGR